MKINLGSPATFKSGFVSIIGRPNVGKSSLLNRLVGEKTAIVSKRPNTTRNKILGIINVESKGQIIFVDTPGIHKTDSPLGSYLVERAYAAYRDADLIVFVTDIMNGAFEKDSVILERLNIQRGCILLLNKIDMLKDRSRLLELIEKYNRQFEFKDIFPVSVFTGENLDYLIENIMTFLPEGPRYFPEGVTTDQPEKFIIAELIREKVFKYTNHEIPYSTAVIVDHIGQGEKKGVIVVQATIYIERDSQKGIIIGKKGKMLKDIGSSARRDIERRFGSNIFLDIFVKVKKGWTKDMKSLYDFGYRD